MLTKYWNLLLAIYRGYTPKYVVLFHRWIDNYERDYSAWIEHGPSESHFFEHPHTVIDSNGNVLPTLVIPIKYRNTPLSRRLIVWGFVAEPWPDYLQRMKVAIQARRAIWAEIRQGTDRNTRSKLDNQDK